VKQSQPRQTKRTKVGYQKQNIERFILQHLIWW